ncbi:MULTISPECIES: YybH family protein [unclassified Mycolicibacterium]|uniref:YybH family protein n=1 Tax=unclassified Mycolicibacterium TaxID=2636767 RepID=UPI002ED80B81
MTDTPLNAVQAYLDGFNAGDATAMSAVFAADGAILDGMPPHLWLGPTAAADWYRDVLTEGAHLGASGYEVTIGEPTHNAVAGDSAYVVAPATMTFDLNGTTVTQTGATFTVALRRGADGWRVAAWAWSKGAQQQ